MFSVLWCVPCCVQLCVPWCVPCKKVFSLFEKLSLSYSTVRFYKVVIEDCDTEIVEFMPVTVLPTFILYKLDCVVEKVEGRNIDNITTFLKSITQ
jgi:thiol-disulfide isomerase/thioredoxin